jgi:hypothetical protein
MAFDRTQRRDRDTFETTREKKKGGLHLDASAAAFAASKAEATRLADRVAFLKKQVHCEEDLRIQVT